MTEKLVQHRHCQMCLKAIPLGEEFCNEECKGDWAKLIRANKKKNLITMLWMIIVVVFVILFMAYI